MPKRGENIRKRKDGRWEGRYKIGSYKNGNTKYASVYGSSYSEVKMKLIEARVSGKTIHSKDKDKLFSEILQLWLDNNKMSRKGATEHKYEYLIEKHINPELGAIKGKEITSTLLNVFLDKKVKSGRLDHKGGLSPSYVKSIVLILQSSIEFAVREGFCNPLTISLCKPTIVKKELPILSKENQLQFETFLFNNLDFTKLGILISLYMGLRIGEICALSWEDIDLINNVIRVNHTVSRVKNDNTGKPFTKLILETPKTASSRRIIPIPSKLIPYLNEMRQKTTSIFVVSNTCTFVSPRTYEYRYHKILSECGIPSINYHALRHTFATRCVEAGVDIKSLSEMLGHANAGITLNIYVHSSIDMKREQIEKLAVL